MFAAASGRRKSFPRYNTHVLLRTAAVVHFIRVLPVAVVGSRWQSSAAVQQSQWFQQVAAKVNKESAASSYRATPAAIYDDDDELAQGARRFDGEKTLAMVL